MSSRCRPKQLLITIASLILVIIFISPPLMARLRLGDDKVKCQRNMKTIGDLTVMLLLRYRGQKMPYGNQLKEDFYLALVFRHGKSNPEMLICPATGDKVDPAWETAKEAPKFKTGPNNCSYFGPGNEDGYFQVIGLDMDAPIAGEHWFNHPDGVNVLFIDSRVVFYRWEDFSLSGPGEVFGKNWDKEPAELDLTNIGGSASAVPSPAPAGVAEALAGGSLFIVIVVIFILAGAAVAGFFVWRNYRKQV